jgi:hypothetical protein
MGTNKHESVLALPWPGWHTRGFEFRELFNRTDRQLVDLRREQQSFLDAHLIEHYWRLDLNEHKKAYEIISDIRWVMATRFEEIVRRRSATNQSRRIRRLILAKSISQLQTRIAA